LRGCGFQEDLIALLERNATSSVRYYSGTVSYSELDEEFAERLYRDLRGSGVRCWKWNHDARTGEPAWGEITDAIKAHEKLILVASRASLNSPPVCREIERALQDEDELLKLKTRGEYEGNPNKLFPIRLDDFVLREWDHPRRADVVSKVIADATTWKTDPSVYPDLLQKLLRDLRVP
jgi:hypothetical protein